MEIVPCDWLALVGDWDSVSDSLWSYVHSFSTPTLRGCAWIKVSLSTVTHSSGSSDYCGVHSANSFCSFAVVLKLDHWAKEVKY